MLNYISVASSMNTKDTLQIDGWLGRIVCKNYEILNKIDQGSFGSVYCAVHQKKNDLYAVKIEQNSKQRQKNGETLRLESEILQIINGQIGFPRLYYYMEDAQNRVLVETLLGSNLEQLFQKQGRRFSLNTVLKFLDQAITRLEVLHQVGFIHRDIKPENFVINEDVIYLIDFGLCMRIYDGNGQHVKQQRGQPLVGTARFTPICSHQGYTQNRASDLESLGYLAIYFLNGTLPWMNVLGNTKEERFFFIGKKKSIVVGNRSLCNGLPREFQQYFDYIFGLQFHQQPNYEYLRKLFRKLQTDEQLEWLQARTVKTEKLRKISEHNSSDEVDKLLMKQSKESHKLGRSSSVKEFQLNIQQNKIMQSRRSVQLDADLKLSECDEYYPYQSMSSKLQQLQPLLAKFVNQK